ncbi:hypothetical protein LTR10_007252 [Elasticomyces elasticus]|nr:hypothetical protein LTR10_007252 [Elasticomyces elasticus]KAK4979069.1 hypothetical protein LTR42_001569 [Elasticomyces elasticus]
MADIRADLFKRLPPELRICIYELVLVADRPLRRLPSSSTTEHSKLVSQPTKSFARMLEVSKYIYVEAFDILYGSNRFKFDLEEANEVEPAAFCKMRDIVLNCTEGADIKGLDEVRRCLCKLTAFCASRSPGGRIALKTATISAHTFARSAFHGVQLRGRSVYFAEMDVGLWTSPPDQTYTINLEHRSLRESWTEILSLPNDISGFDLLVDFEINNPFPNERSKKKMLVQAMALDLVFGVGLTHPGWLTCNWPWFRQGIGWYDGYSERDGLYHGITERLRDVSAKSRGLIIAWANNIITQI